MFHQAYTELMMDKGDLRLHGVSRGQQLFNLCNFHSFVLEAGEQRGVPLGLQKDHQLYLKLVINKALIVGLEYFQSFREYSVDNSKRKCPSFSLNLTVLKLGNNDGFGSVD